MEPASLTEHVAVVTGAARGIGREIAVTLARKGASVALVDAGSTATAATYSLAAAGELEATAADIQAQGARALSLPADMRSDTDVHDALERAREELGPIDIVVSNAGVSCWADPWELELSAWDDVIATNLRGAWLVTHDALPGMIAGDWGRIVYVSSVAAFRPTSKSAAYAASKAGLVAMAKSVAIDVAPHGITVNTVHPGIVDTAMVRGITGGVAEELDKLVHRNVIPGAVPVAAVANAVEWLCQPASGHVTGQAIVVDNGYLLS